jgi:Cu(I)/Ag(I) efflux system membrane fusion protein
MEGKISYRGFESITHTAWLMIMLILIIIGCGRKEQKHNNHQPITSTSMDSAMHHDSMPGMNMGNESNNHASHNPISDSNAAVETMQPDSSLEETYWNTLPTNKTVIAKQQVVKPVLSDMSFLINGNGYIAFDMRLNRKVPVRVGGRIERLFVKYNYQYVRKGEKILELYSPELNTYVEEYLFVKRQANDSTLQNKAKQKLLLLGLTPLQIKQIDQSGQASFTIPVYSPFEGYVLFNPSGPPASMGNAGNASGGMGGGMNSAKNSSVPVAGSVLSDNSIREGMYVSKDQTLFWINDFKEAWGIIAFTKENEKYIAKGQSVTVRSELFPEKPIQTSIQLIEQVYQGGQKFTQTRVYLPNEAGMLKQNSLITATVSVPVKSLMVPASSVYYLGQVAIVWVQVGVTKEGSNIFQSRVVRIGHRSDNKVEILEGLKQNEAVAKDAGYLADSETIIKY